MDQTGIRTSTAAQTRAYAAALAEKAAPGMVIALIGDLGSGKTEFVRGFVDHFDSSIIVRSPSFTLVNMYNIPQMPIYHFDFYRLTEPEELIEIGFQEYISGNGVCLIEWADMFLDELPEDATIKIHFIRHKDGSRQIRADKYEV